MVSLINQRWPNELLQSCLFFIVFQSGMRVYEKAVQTCRIQQWQQCVNNALEIRGNVIRCSDFNVLECFHSSAIVALMHQHETKLINTHLINTHSKITLRMSLYKHILYNPITVCVAFWTSMHCRAVFKTLNKLVFNQGCGRLFFM